MCKGSGTGFCQIAKYFNARTEVDRSPDKSSSRSQEEVIITYIISKPINLFNFLQMLGKAYLVLFTEAVFPPSLTSAKTFVEMLHAAVNQLLSASALETDLMQNLKIISVLCAPFFSVLKHI